MSSLQQGLASPFVCPLSVHLLLFSTPEATAIGLSGKLYTGSRVANSKEDAEVKNLKKYILKN